MKRGLVIGRFMPLHKGHCALIRFAATQCEELIVSMTFRPEDPISGPLRFEWIKEEFSNEPSIGPELSLDDFDDESLPLSERMPRWSTFLKKRFPSVDVIISSENYGIELAKILTIKHVAFDFERKKFPVSATMIREKPFRYWDFISLPARPFFVKKICFYGPESTGKSTMAKLLAEKYKTEFVPEVSREMITTNDFSLDDIIRIGQAQTDRVIEKSKTANKLLFCDTDVITTEIYCQHYLETIPEILFELEQKITYDRYFLFEPDVPWVADGLRDLWDRRTEMFEVFKTELDKRKISYELVNGTFEQRSEQIVRSIDVWF